MGKKYIDVKYTIWDRIHLDENINLDDVIAVLQEEGVYAVEGNTDLGYIHTETMYDTMDAMSTVDNSGNPVIEVYDDYNLIYSQ
jgi:hypothetical protein